jgi:hypothetical protein
MACKSSWEAHGKIGARASPVEARTAAIRSPATGQPDAPVATPESARGNKREGLGGTLPYAHWRQLRALAVCTPEMSGP